MAVAYIQYKQEVIKKLKLTLYMLLERSLKDKSPHHLQSPQHEYISSSQIWCD